MEELGRREGTDLKHWEWGGTQVGGLDPGEDWEVEKGGGEQIPRVKPLSLKRKIMCGSLSDLCSSRWLH